MELVKANNEKTTEKLPPQCCGKCIYFGKKNDQLLCFRYPPAVQVLVMPGGIQTPTGVQPQISVNSFQASVAVDGWCGDFAKSTACG